jgi:hypothetical protein
MSRKTVASVAVGDMPRAKVKVPVTTMPIASRVSNPFAGGFVLHDGNGVPQAILDTTVPGEMPIRPTISSSGLPFEVNRRSGGHPLSHTAPANSNNRNVAVTGTLQATGSPFPLVPVALAGLVVWFVFFRKG